VRRPVPPSGPPDKAVVMPGSPPPWLLFALGSAFFAALTAIFAKLGVSHFNSDLATLVRTVVILVVTVAIVSVRGEWRRPDALPVRPVLFLVLSGIATGLYGSVTFTPWRLVRCAAWCPWTN